MDFACLRRSVSAFALACAAVCSLAAGAEFPIAWQPYRETEGLESTPVVESQVAAQGSIEALAMPVSPPDAPGAFVAPVADPAVLCPQPILAAPAAGSLMLIDPAANLTSPSYWRWRVLPTGVVWQSYWAGVHEPRISGVPFADQDGNALMDVTLGGRAAILRYGTDGPGRPLGAELQIEGAAFPRLNLDENWDLEATDFRFGLPLVYGREMWQAKFSYYHLSSHKGDELAVRTGSFDRINFSRDALAAAVALYPFPAWRWYAEAAWAFHYDDGSEPWEFQFGVDVAEPGATGAGGAPFFAVNGHLREEHNFGGNVVFQAGWLWRGNATQTLRVGFHYFNGKTNQFEFFDRFEEQIGGGLWCEF